jgi:hypothetical protein
VHDAIVAEKEIYNRMPKKCDGKNGCVHAWKQFVCGAASRTHIHHMPLTKSMRDDYVTASLRSHLREISQLDKITAHTKRKAIKSRDEKKSSSL